MRKSPAPVVIAALLLAGLRAPAMAIAPGNPAPNFTLSDVRGNSYTLSDYRGRVVLLAFVGWG